MDKTTELWRVPVAVEDIPDAGLHVELEAPEEARAALAAVAGLRSIPALKASFDVNRRGAAVHVAGRVEAVVGQTCVVTLEPVDNRVSEEVDLLFSPDVAPVADAPAEGGHSIGHTADEDDAPEPLVGDTIDLGAVATEFLMLGIDPYPRKDGVRFQAPQADSDGAHPFAALAALKKPPEGGTRS
ncbi:MAG: YceD family protein [Pseudolabrys sp.]